MIRLKRYKKILIHEDDSNIDLGNHDLDIYIATNGFTDGTFN